MNSLPAHPPDEVHHAMTQSSRTSRARSKRP
jgi:hypothetical protein